MRNSKLAEQQPPKSAHMSSVPRLVSAPGPRVPPVHTNAGSGEKEKQEEKEELQDPDQDLSDYRKDAILRNAYSISENQVQR